MKTLKEIINESLNITMKNSVLIPKEIMWELIPILDKFSDQLDPKETKIYNDFLDVLYDEKSGNWNKIK